MKRWIILFFACMVMVSCAGVGNKTAGGVKLAAPSAQDDVSEYLNFAESFSNAPNEKQKQEFAAIQQALSVNPNNLLQRMKLVMVYGLGASSLKDSVKAQNLLQQILQENILTGQKLAFAHILFDYFVELNRTNKGGRDTDKRIEQLLQKNETLQQKNDALQNKLDAMQQKLDELKKIEKAMGARDTPPNK